MINYLSPIFYHTIFIETLNFMNFILFYDNVGFHGIFYRNLTLQKKLLRNTWQVNQKKNEIFSCTNKKIYFFYKKNNVTKKQKKKEKCTRLGESELLEPKTENDAPFFCCFKFNWCSKILIEWRSLSDATITKWRYGLQSDWSSTNSTHQRAMYILFLP